MVRVTEGMRCQLGDWIYAAQPKDHLGQCFQRNQILSLPTMRIMKDIGSIPSLWRVLGYCHVGDEWGYLYFIALASYARQQSFAMS